MTLEQHPWQNSLGSSGPALYPSARPEGIPAEERSSDAAAATLERLRAQNRRHQANHRARVKVSSSTTYYSRSASARLYLVRFGLFTETISTRLCPRRLLI